jgi:hypothetical protein
VNIDVHQNRRCCPPNSTASEILIAINAPFGRTGRPPIQ